MAVDDLIARELEECSERTVWKFNCLVYAGAVVVEKFVKQSLVRPGGGGCPRVESTRRREAEVTELRRKIVWLMSEISRRKTSPKMTERLCRNQAHVRRIFGPQNLREMEARLEPQKGFLSVRCHQLRRLKKTLRRKKLNKQYRRLDQRVLEKQNGASSSVFAQLSADQVTEYWNGVLGVSGTYSLEDPAVRAWQEEVRKIPTSTWEEPDLVVWMSALKNSSSRKAPGRDGLCAFWRKFFHRESGFLWETVREVLKTDVDLPAWFVKGRTVLISKAGWCEET